MKNIFYMAPSLREAIIFIERNTDWKRVTRVSFRNGDENIVVIDSLMRMRGRHIDGIYIDHSFSSIPEDIKHELNLRFNALNIEPVLIEERQ